MAVAEVGHGSAAALPYHEPTIVTILIQASCLLLLNVVNAVLDRLVFCGLLGQVLIGVAWGTPGAKWLSSQVEEVVVQLGYIGLILIVYEGGLSTSFKSLKANLGLSSAVAVTGIGVPIALSFSLQSLLDATPLQAFAAGAALCSTSLGTTFTVLASSGLSNSRLGVVLTSAAMMDDVIGLVMVQVISNLGRDMVAPLTCRLIVKPTTLSLNRHRAARPTSKVAGLLMLRQTAFAIHTLLLIALVAASAYAGTSSLLAAYIAGATISWWDSEVPHRGTQAEPNEASTLREASTSDENQRHGEEKPKTQSNMRSDVENITAGTAIYEHYYAQVVSKILQPFFFASIGLSIPITRMFSGYIVWRGIIYSILMTVGKLVCGLWLVRLPVLPAGGGLQKHLTKLKLPKVPHFWGKSDVTAKDLKNAGPGEAPAEATTPGAASKPLSLYPPLILALAMTARGEIGFLISAVSESKGVFYPPPAGESLGHESDIFLVVTWAIVLCTIIGPLGVGLCVRRVKTLEERKKRDHGGRGKDVLGVWGIE